MIFSSKGGLGIGGKSFSSLKSSYRTGGMALVSNSLGFKNSIVSESDIACLEAYNAELDNCVSTQTAWYRTMQTASPAAQKLVEQANYGKVATQGLTTATNASTTAMIGARIAATALNAVIGMGIGLIISLLASGISALVENAKENLKPIAEKLADVNSELEELHSSMTEIADDYQSLKNSADEVIPRFVELAEGVDKFGKNVSLTDEEYTEFLSLNNKIAEMFPELNMGMDDNGNAMLNLSYTADTLTESLYALLEAEREQANQALIEKMPDLVKDISKKTDLLNEQIEGYKNSITQYQQILNGEYYENNFGSDQFYESLKAKGINVKREAVGTGQGYMGYEYTRYRYYIDDADSERVINDYIAGWKRQINNAELQIENAWNSLGASLTAWLKTNSTFDSFSESLQKIAMTMVSNVDWSSLGLKTQDEITGYVERNILEPLSKASFEVQDGFAALLEIKPSDFKSVDEYKAAIMSKIQEIADMDETDGIDFDNLFKGLGYDQILEKYDEAVDGIKKALPDVSEAMVESLAPDDVIEAFNYISAYGITSWDDVVDFIDTKDIVDAIDISKIEDLKDELDDLKDTWDDINEIIEDYNENGYLSVDNLKDLMDMEPEYINLLIDENGQINLNNQAYRDYVAAKAKMLVLDQVKSLYSTIIEMGIEEAQAYANAEAYDTENNSLIDLISTMYSYYLIQAKAKDAANNTTAYTDALKRSQYTVANYMAVYDNWLKSLTTSQNEFSTAAQSTKDALENEKDALEDAKDALEDYKDELNDGKDALQDLIDLVTDYIKQMKEDEKSALEDQIDALDKQKDALDESKDKYAEIIDAKKEALKLAKEEKEAAEELADKQKSVAKDRLALEVAGLDDSSAGRKAYKQAKDNLADSQKDLSDYLADQSYEKQVAELEDLQEKFEESIEKRKTAIDNQVAYINSKIDEIDKYLDNSRKLYEDACAMIDNDNGELYANLWNYTYTYTTQTKAEFDHMWTTAQEALAKYRGENDSLLEVMEYLQLEIYDTETEISNLDDAIDATSDAIDATSDSIDNVSSSLDGLGTTIADYMAQLQALQEAANSIDVNSNDEKTAFWVNYNGKKYQTGYNYNGDNAGNRYLAASELTKLIAKDISGFDQYGLGIVQGLLGVGSNPTYKTWFVDYYGKRYTSYKKTKSEAIEDIISQIPSSNDRRARAGIRNAVQSKISYYAKGTRNSNSLAITQEDGLEAIFGNLGQGQYTLMPQGSQVFDHQRTDNLYNFAGDPEKFLADKGLSPLSADELSNFGLWGNSLAAMKFGEAVFTGANIAKEMTNGSRDVYNNDNSASNDVYSCVVNLNIQGGADQSTAQAINKAKRDIKDEMLKELTRLGERNRRMKR